MKLLVGLFLCITASSSFGATYDEWGNWIGGESEKKAREESDQIVAKHLAEQRKKEIAEEKAANDLRLAGANVAALLVQRMELEFGKVKVGADPAFFRNSQETQKLTNRNQILERFTPVMESLSTALKQTDEKKIVTIEVQFFHTLNEALDLALSRTKFRSPERKLLNIGFFAGTRGDRLLRLFQKLLPDAKTEIESLKKNLEALWTKECERYIELEIKKGSRGF